MALLPTQLPSSIVAKHRLHKWVMQSILMGHRGDVHPLKRSVKAHLLNNVLGKLNAMLLIL